MNYYVAETEFEAGEQFKRTAWSKARADIETVLNNAGYTAIYIQTHEKERKYASKVNKLLWHNRIRKTWKTSLNNLKKGDTLFVQLPILDHSVLLAHEFKMLKKRGVHIIEIVHDLETMRYSLLNNKNNKLSSFRLKLEEVGLINQADKVIFHNSRMIEIAKSLGISDNKIVNLEIFDYLIDDSNFKSTSDNDGYVIIAGNLSEEKAGYIYRLPDDVSFRLYGINYKNEKKSNIDYKGSFDPDKLINELRGSFGLVWDGPSEKTCSGIYGAYLKVNNPHKTSLYLAAGIPVIIWKDAALSGFIEKHKCGILVDSLDQISSVLRAITPSDYEIMKKNAEMVGKELRNGEYTRKALDNSKM